MSSYRFEAWEEQRDVRDRSKPAWGLCIHATGSTITVRALEKGRDPNAYAADYYGTPGHAFPHDLVSWKYSFDFALGVGVQAPDGGPAWSDVIGIADWRERSHAQGLGKEAVQIYSWNGGRWRNCVKHKEEGYIDSGAPLQRYDWWLQRHGSNSPLDLFPGRDPNQVLLSMEILVPVEPKKRGGYRRTPFTLRQHDVAAWRAAQMVREYGWPEDELRSRILGHADIHPITRTARSGPWDPGTGRWWDWDVFFAHLSDHLKETPAQPNSGPAEHD